MTEIVKHENETVVKPAHDIVASSAPEFRKQLYSLVEEGARELVIDLTGVEMIDSAGIGVLADIHDSLAKAGGKLVVSNVSKDIRDLFKAIRLDQHLTVLSA